ncbi:hypothetical protein BASA50_001491 [Batrachochytrium salamandrivorans]|uniref:Transcription initiation factor TFIID subunit 8 n=1 Tax=Batrachochytrium salamandrivorans TaxID=1357716 RepID=A0ABQ8FP51_9FUNG|nr:hypothetical protein BASA62_002081 [Batrachochytrium salamandrivorans]KAH6583512.1 hypothetical protein BASA60_001396 [Batrachochytrium salamandrivorans]KAH6596724.1 hypothetical protein BASA61_003418 [Batrachochytrium salamandrivorans]KAH6601634.1 hypothetical protein BASA50_001491 [Batrachochytrium salamandrivorans]KAH9250667.1 hypothetical protein BASA81_011518 [Batrachochytrium salamandrivorans]
MSTLLGASLTVGNATSTVVPASEKVLLNSKTSNSNGSLLGMGVTTATNGSITAAHTSGESQSQSTATLTARMGSTVAGTRLPKARSIRPNSSGSQAAPPLSGQLLRQVHHSICARVLQKAGYEAVLSEALAELEAVMEKFIFDLLDRIHIYAELNGHTRPTLQDMSLGFTYLGISIPGLYSYANQLPLTNSTYPNTPIVLHNAPRDSTAWVNNPFFSSQMSLSTLNITAKPPDLPPKLTPLPDWMKPHFPPLPAPHSYLSSQIPIHPDTEGAKEREASVEQAKLMERNLKRLLLGGILDDSVGLEQFEPVNYLAIKYRRV